MLLNLFCFFFFYGSYFCMLCNAFDNLIFFSVQLHSQFGVFSATSCYISDLQTSQLILFVDIVTDL